MLRDEVADALKDPQSPLVRLAKDWRQLLFPQASDRQFADAYAQTVTFALLLERSEGADSLALDSGINVLASDHSLLSRALQVLTDSNVRTEIGASLDLVLRVIGAVPPATFAGPQNPWLYFYKDFSPFMIRSCVKTLESVTRLLRLMPWQHSGVQLKRTWPIGPDIETLYTAGAAY